MCQCVLFGIIIAGMFCIFSFLRQHIGSSGPETADVEALKLEVVDLRAKLEKMNEENTDLKQKVNNDTCCVKSVLNAL